MRWIVSDFSAVTAPMFMFDAIYRFSLFKVFFRSYLNYFKSPCSLYRSDISSGASSNVISDQTLRDSNFIDSGTVVLISMTVVFSGIFKLNNKNSIKYKNAKPSVIFVQMFGTELD